MDAGDDTAVSSSNGKGDDENTVAQDTKNGPLETGQQTRQSKHVDAGALFCLGSSMVDVTAECDSSLLERYGLRENDSVLARERHGPLFDEVTAKSSGSDPTPGGSALNTAKVAQWILGVLHGPRRVSFVSCVGDDEYGDLVERRLEEAGVSAVLARHPTEPTGVCAALVTPGDQRSMCTRLGASRLFGKEHLEAAAVREALARARVVYCVAYFLTHSPECVVEVADVAYKEGKMFVLNLSAPYVCEHHLDRLLACIPYVDAIVGNAAEALAFGRALGLATEDLQTVAGTLSQLPNFKMRPRIVALTDGPKPVLVVDDAGRMQEFAVESVAGAVVDTIAAGDAFAGGFLAKLVEGGSVDEAVRCGIRAASFIVRQKGCTLPDSPPPNL